MCTGSFRLVAGNRHLHRHYKFAVPVGKTVALSLRHSCRSELTRQGISLSYLSLRFRRSWTLSFTSCVHCLRDGPNLFDAFARQMFFPGHQLQDPSELRKIDSLL